MSAALPTIVDVLTEYVEHTDTGKRHTVTVTTGAGNTMRVAFTHPQWLTVAAEIRDHGKAAFPVGVIA